MGCQLRDVRGHMKTILVTGGAGFIGSHFVRRMLSNYPDYRVIVLDALNYAGDPDNLTEEVRNNPRFSFWWGNVRNAEMVDELVSMSDVVIHFAAESHVARSIYDNVVFYETDVLGTHTIANAVLRHQNRIERFIHISTSEVYGTAVSSPMAEDHPLNPMSPYASAKAGADRLVYSYWTTYGLPTVIIRPFNNYGGNQHLEKVIPRFITNALRDQPLTIHGDGSSSRDWLFVEDHCAALDRVIHAPIEKVRGQEINLGTGIDTSVADIARMVLKLLGKPDTLTVNMGDRPGQVARHISSTEKAKRLLDWQATTKLEDGLVKTIEWYQRNPVWWERRLWMVSVPIKTREGKIEYH